jgi:hypothetical protein
MAAKGGQPGNKNAVKNRPITEAITRALLANDGEKLRKLADALVDRAIDSDTRAAIEVNDRIEGKVTQPIAGTGDDGELLIRWLGKS